MGVLLRAATEDDVPAIVALLQDPAIKQWWGENTADDVRQELPASWVIVVDGEVAGWLQYHEETEPMYRSVAFDLVVAVPFQGRGIGRAALREAISYFITRGHHRFTIDPAISTEKAIRCYTAVGFKRVGVLREAELAPDGSGWRDALMMDLLAREFDAEA